MVAIMNMLYMPPLVNNIAVLLPENMQVPWSVRCPSFRELFETPFSQLTFWFMQLPTPSFYPWPRRVTFSDQTQEDHCKRHNCTFPNHGCSVCLYWATS